MNNTEAIRLFREVRSYWLTLMEKGDYEASGGEKFDQALTLLESEPEPTEFTSKIREVWPADKKMNIGWFVDNLQIACDIIDRKTAKLKVKDDRIKVLQTKIRLALNRLQIACDIIDRKTADNQ